MELTDVILLLLKISITLNVLALGLKAAHDEATYLFRHPAELGRAFLSMNMVMPLTALALGLSFNLKPAMKIALVALSVSPVPPVFPIASDLHLSRSSSREFGIEPSIDPDKRA
jgi:BASS family bile acid:Na+ symporter